MNWCEFESLSRHKVAGKKILAGPSVGQNMELSARFGKNRRKNMIICFSTFFKLKKKDRNSLAPGLTFKKLLLTIIGSKVVITVGSSLRD